MNREQILQKIKRKARVDARNRRDPRFINTMGLLVAKGLLRTNFDVPLLPNKRLDIEDVLWAGRNVEPRILEVLPGAVVRLGAHFRVDPIKHRDLIEVTDQLRRRQTEGKAFEGIPYERLRVWAEFDLRDKRIKPLGLKKRLKSFRLAPQAIERLQAVAEKSGKSETEVLEELLLRL